jgi:hypothetical protein
MDPTQNPGVPGAMPPAPVDPMATPAPVVTPPVEEPVATPTPEPQAPVEQPPVMPAEGTGDTSTGGMPPTVPPAAI